jgi:hypothetical protein
MGEIVTLGEVRCPSGQLVIIDGGMLGMWSGSRPPNELDPRGLGIEDPDLLAEVAGAADYKVVGPDDRGKHRQYGVDDRRPRLLAKRLHV